MAGTSLWLARRADWEHSSNPWPRRYTKRARTTEVVEVFDASGPHNESMRGMRKEEHLLDGAIMIGTTTVRVHKLVLAAHSPFLRRLWSGEFADSADSDAELHDVRPEAVGTLIDCAYNDGTLELSPG